MKINNVISSLLAFACVTSARAYYDYPGEDWYNCKEYAMEIGVTGYSASYDFVREWNTRKKVTHVYDPGTGTWYEQVEGGWVDGLPDNTPSNRISGCWLKVSLAPKKDYVFSVDSSKGVSIVTEPVAKGTKTKFSSVSKDGKLHAYIRAGDWKTEDLLTQKTSFEFYLHIRGPLDSIGQSFDILAEQDAIEKYVQEFGTAEYPFLLGDVSAAGSTTISNPIEKQYSRWATTYQANLKPGGRYVFHATSPSADYELQISTLDWMGIPGECSYGKFWNPYLQRDEEDLSTLIVTVTDEYAMSLVILAQHMTALPTGGTLSWEMVPLKDPEPLEGGTFHGALSDADFGSVQAEFSVVVKIMDDGSTNFSALVRIDGQAYAYMDNLDGEIAGKTAFGDSFFSVSLTDDGGLSVAGSLKPDDRAGDEFWFVGILDGALLPWDESLLRFDPAVDSAADMGITAGAFRNEDAGSPVLAKVWSWGVANNVSATDLNDMTFSASGDPANLITKAYLLACAPASDAVVEAESAFVITGFDVSKGVNGVRVADGLVNGDAYGNGTIEVRTSLTPGGNYSKGTKQGTQMFYKAFLVK